MDAAPPMGGSDRLSVVAYEPHLYWNGGDTKKKEPFSAAARGSVSD